MSSRWAHLKNYTNCRFLPAQRQKKLVSAITVKTQQYRYNLNVLSFHHLSVYICIFPGGRVLNINACKLPSHQHVMHYQLNVSISGLAGLVRLRFFNDPGSLIFMRTHHRSPTYTEEFPLLFSVADFFCIGILRRCTTSTAARGIFARQRNHFHRLQAVETIPGKAMSVFYFIVFRVIISTKMTLRWRSLLMVVAAF